jgi:hypothetical protein
MHAMPPFPACFMPVASFLRLFASVLCFCCVNVPLMYYIAFSFLSLRYRHRNSNAGKKNMEKLR